MDWNRLNGAPMVSTTSYHRPLARDGGLAPMVLMNGRYYVQDGYFHCWPGPAGSNGTENRHNESTEVSISSP